MKLKWNYIEHDIVFLDRKKIGIQKYEGKWVGYKKNVKK